jgi:hypothetical protein
MDRQITDAREPSPPLKQGGLPSPTEAGGGFAAKLRPPKIIDDGAMAIGLLCDSLTGAAKLGREILQLRKTVFHAQHCLGVVDMNARLEGQRGNCRGKHIDQTEGWMVRQQVAAALLAVLARAERRFLESCDMLGSCRDLHGLRFPETEGIHWSAGPRTARTAVTVTHSFRRTGDFQFNRATKTFSNVRHILFSFLDSFSISNGLIKSIAPITTPLEVATFSAHVGGVSCH